MKQVFKCDFCSQTDEKDEVILKHEAICGWNPLFKKCFTCTHQCDIGHEYSIPGCEINLDTIKGRDGVNCPGWKEF
jgi:hypothetical protein